MRLGLIGCLVVAAACDQRLSAAPLDSELHVRVINQSRASAGRQVEIALRSGTTPPTTPRRWTEELIARPLDLTVAAAIPLIVGDTLAATVRVVSASKRRVAVVPVEVAIQPNSNYSLIVWIGKRDRTWRCLPHPKKAALHDIATSPDTVYVFLSGMSKNALC